LFYPSLAKESSALKAKKKECITADIHGTIMGDFEDAQEPQHATGYQIQMMEAEYHDSHKNAIVINPWLRFDLTVQDLQRFLASWELEEGLRPFWLAMQKARPPMQKLKIRLVFNTAGRLNICTDCYRNRYKVEMSLMNLNGIIIGEMLSTLYRSIWWPEIRVRCGVIRPSQSWVSCVEYVRVLPLSTSVFPGQDESASVLPERLFLPEEDCLLSHSEGAAVLPSFDWEEPEGKSLGLAWMYGPM
jgi:hypothetical protein